MADDVGKLFGLTDWCGPLYKTFRGQRSEAAPAPISAEADHGETPQHPLVTEEEPQPAADRGVNPPVSRLSLLSSRESRIDGRMGPRFGVLRSVLGESNSTTAVMQPARVPVLRVLGSTGGSGVTSILAGLARHMAGIGEGTLIIDADPESPLPFHFGFSHLQDSPGLKTAVIPGTRPVFLLKRHTEQTSATQQPRCTWLEEGLMPLRHCLDRILVDGTPRFWECLPPVEFDHALNLVVLTPDLNSLSRLDNILKRLGTQPVLFVLNKFDNNNSLHEQVRLWLQRKLGERLLSVTIRRTDEVPEALADGVTVLDYAPAASISEDYRELCTILRQWDGTNNPGIHNAVAEISA